MAGVIPRPAVLKRSASSAGVLYAWLLFSLFIDYTRPLGLLPFLKIPLVQTIIPLLLFVVTMFAPGMRPAKDIFSDTRTKWVLILIVLILMSTAMHGFDQLGTDVIMRVVGYTATFFTIARLVTSEQRLMGVVATLVVAHLYVLALNFQVLANPSLRQYLTGAPFLGDGNDFALSIGLLFPCIIGVALHTRSNFGRVLAWLAAAVIPLALVATQSRGATLGLGAVVLYLWLRSSKKMVSAVGVLMLGGMIMVYAPPAYFQRMSTVSTAASQDSSAEGRIKAWSGSVGMAVSHPLGIGAGHFGVYWGKTAHSTYFLALGELGIPGFVCVLILIFGNLRASLRVRKQVLAQLPTPPPEDAQRSLGLLDMINGGLLFFAVAGGFLSATYYPHIYVMFGMLLAAREFALRHAPQPLAITRTPANKPAPGARGGLPEKRLASASK